MPLFSEYILFVLEGIKKPGEVFLRIPSHKLETSVVEGLDSGVRLLLEFCFAILKAFFSPAVWYT